MPTGFFSLEVGDTATSAFFVGIDVSIPLAARVATNIEAVVDTTFGYDTVKINADG